MAILLWTALTLDDTICGLADLANLGRKSFKVDTAWGSIGKPCNKCLVIKALCVENEAISTTTNELTTGDLK